MTAASTARAFAQPKPVDGVHMAFGGDMATLMPSMADVPAEFHQHRGNDYVDFVQGWFFGGADATRLVPRDGIDMTAALRHLKAIMASWEPKHEHKTAGVAYLLSLWFTLRESQKKP